LKRGRLYRCSGSARRLVRIREKGRIKLVRTIRLRGIIIFITRVSKVCTVTLPFRRASIRPGNLDGARTERPHQKKIARAVLKSPERRAIIIFRAIINLIFFVSFSLRRATRRKETGRCPRRILVMTADTTFPTSDSRTEKAPAEQDSAESRVDFAPCN